jgi:ATP-dependent DNA helicase RecQ
MRLRLLTRRRLLRTARDAFGWDRLRPGQQQSMQHVLDGHDVLTVMPTGAGKSAVYQVCALLLEGPTVVVSPLIALQRDQVEDLDRDAVGGAAAVSSAVDSAIAAAIPRASSTTQT